MAPTGFSLVQGLVQKTDSRIVLVVMDGLGGLPHPDTGKTELETARTPNLDRLAGQSLCGLSVPVALGITPGSGPGHLALFGYDPLVYDIGRGVLEALGLDMDVREGDVAARGNLCTVDAQGLVTDRRAGRVASSVTADLCGRLASIHLDGAQVVVAPGREHRFALLFRGPGLSDALTSSDPQREGVAPLLVKPTKPEAERTARLVNEFVEQALQALKDSRPANMLLLRGFSQYPRLPQMPDVYKLDPVAVAAYPMYRGVAKLVGMMPVPTGETVEEEFEAVAQQLPSHDFVFVHIKGADSAGEDGDFPRKVEVVERFDRALPMLLDLRPDVLAITGDHSTPAVLRGHSWHPVPLLIHSRWVPAGFAQRFTERECLTGGLGTVPATGVMPLLLANALKLQKYGA